MNGDYLINILDVILVLDYILEQNVYNFNICSVDMNMNSVLNITDIIIMLELILDR